MFFDLIPGPVKNFFDSIFNPPISFLQMGVDYLSNVALIAGKGISLNNYFSFFSYLPSTMQAVVNSILAAIIFLAVLQLVKSILRMYFTAKDAVKWW
jgi:large-conductance mechanosensitive channel